MNTMRHKDALSNTTLHRIINNKYNKPVRSLPLKDVRTDYVILSTGWRRRIKTTDN